MLLRVTKYGEPVLERKGEPVLLFDAALRRLYEDMVETMHHEHGVGLAAPQVGVSRRFFVVDLTAYGEPDFEYTLDGKQVPLGLFMPLAVANPELSFICDYEWEMEEGCLSFPGIRLDGIVRPDRVRLRYQDLDGLWHELVCDGFFARCLQHEYDHVEGVLFTRRAPRRELKRHQEALAALRRETEAFLKGTP